MEKSDLVSIVVPVYNTEAFLERCVESALNQTYKNVEIILVEDGSTDGSLNKCKELVKKHPNISLVKHEKNMGQEATRNDGIDASRGKWLLFLDSDDTIETNAIEELIAITKDCNVNMIMFDFTYIEHDRKTVARASMEPGLYTKSDFVKNLLTKLPLHFVSCIGSKFYNVNFLQKNKLKFNSKYKFNEDGGFALEVIENIDAIYYLNKSFYNYILRDSGSIQTSYRQDMYLTIKNVHLLLNHIIEENNCDRQVKKRFNLLCAQFIRVCLKNEKQFKGYDSFVNMYYILKKDEMYGPASKRPFAVSSFIYCVFLLLFKLRLKKLLYLMV